MSVITIHAEDYIAAAVREYAAAIPSPRNLPMQYAFIRTSFHHSEIP